MSKIRIEFYWMPPPQKCDAGIDSVGYDPYDFYDLGSYNWKFTTETRYGSENELINCVTELRKSGIQPICDLVLNHMNGGESSLGWGDPLYRYNYQYDYHRRFQKIDTNGVINAKDYYNVNYTNQPFGMDWGFGNSSASNAWESTAESADINQCHPYQRQGLEAWGDWLTAKVGYSGYRFDFTQGMEPWFIAEFMNTGIKKDRFAVMEYWIEDHNASQRERKTWLELTDNRAALFDMELHEALTHMCNGDDPSFQMSSLSYCGLIHEYPSRAVTFVESHDSIRPKGDDNKLGITTDKLLAYAYIMMSEGIPMVAYNDYLIGPYADVLSPNDNVDDGWTGAPLKNQIDQLIEIRKLYAGGTSRYLSNSNKDHLFVMQRTGNAEKAGCILALNDGSTVLTDTVNTGWTNAILVDMLDSSHTITNNENGIVSVSVPGRDYRIYVLQ